MLHEKEIRFPNQRGTLRFKVDEFRNAIQGWKSSMSWQQPRATSLSWSWTSFQAKERNGDINENIRSTWHVCHVCRPIWATESPHIHAYMYKSKEFPPREMQRMQTVCVIKWEFPVSTAIFLGRRVMDIIGESDQQLAHFWATEGARGGKNRVSVAVFVLPQGFWAEVFSADQ